MEEHLILYHGSPSVIEHPFFGGGKPHNDYGPGFYCTEELGLAYEWARPDFRSGFANKYYLETDGLNVLNLNEEPFHILNWLAVLLQNRKFFLGGALAAEARDYMIGEFLPDYDKYDVVRGWRADDSYFAFAKAFLNGSISLEQLSHAMKLGKLGEQVVVRSEKAFASLYYLAAAPAPDIFAAKRKARDEAAREEFRKMAEGLSAKDGVYILDILRGKWKNDDARLR